MVSSIGKKNSITKHICAFVQQSDIEVIDEDETAKQTMFSELDRFIMDSQLSRHMQELIGKYIMMEEYFMRETVLKVSRG